MDKSLSQVWMRLGDNADYEKYDDAYEAGTEVGYRYESSGELPYVEKYGKYGVQISPGFIGFNYVSLFWGDDDAQPEKALTLADLADFKRGIREGAGLPLPKKHIANVKRKLVKKSPLNSGLSGLR